VSLNALVTEIDKARDGTNLSSTLRVYVLKQAKRKISRA
jgi:predicted DNA-binding ribbon-helix-helix protein